MTSPTRLAFGDFELHTDSGELYRGGERVAIQHQPAQLLELLARRSGEVVSRDEIRDEIWGVGTYVDSEQGINFCVRQIRQALDDDAAAPRYVKTVPRRGYRFLVPVTEHADGAPGPPEPSTRGGRRRPRRRLAAAAGLVFAVLLALAVAWRLDGPREETPAPDAPASGPLVVPEEAHSRFLEARYLVERAPEGDMVDDATRAIELLQAVVEEVPAHAEAHAALADAWLLRLDLPRPEAMERAEAAAWRALDLEPDLAQARTVLAAALFFHHLDWTGSWEHLERALEADPSYPDAVFMKGVYLSAVGRHDQAIAAARRAARLEPGQLPGISLAWFYFFARRYPRAIEEAERILELQPLDEPSHNVLVYTHLARGDEAAADREIDRFHRLRLDVPPSVPLGFPPVRELYRTWWENRHMETSPWVSPTLQASIGAIAGAVDGTLAYLLEACEGRTASWDLPFVAVDPRWDPLRRDPRFDEVVDCVGVPGFARQAPRLPPPGE